jgi:hypothetical protein
MTYLSVVFVSSGLFSPTGESPRPSMMTSPVVPRQTAFISCWLLGMMGYSRPFRL